MTSVDIHSLSGAYALDAVDELERAAFERHLRECDACDLEVRELRETVARLSDSDAVPAPDSLRTSVLAEVARTPQIPPAGSGRATRGPRSRAWGMATAVSVAAAVIAGAVGVGAVVLADRQVDDARRATAVAEAAASAERDRAAAVQRVLAAPDVRLVSRTIDSGATVTLAVARSLDSAVAVLGGLPALDAGRVYQLWMIPPGDPAQVAVSAGVMGVGATANTALARVGASVKFGVTVEPAGGSPRPTLANLVTLVDVP